MTSVGTISSLWRYPAKSMMGDEFPWLPADHGGVVGDRGWAVRDEVRGGIRGAKKIGGLMKMHARYRDEPRAGAPPPPIEIRLPDGEVLQSDEADTNDRLSRFLDHQVTLWPLQPPADLDHYRRGLIEYESPPGSYFDAFPILVVTDRSLATLAELAPGSDFDVRRFRPNIVVATDERDGNFPEQDWMGRRLRLGDVELEVTAPCPRCVMVTRDFADLPQDRQVLRTIVRDAEQNVGVYANVTEPGTLTTGASVTLV